MKSSLVAVAVGTMHIEQSEKMIASFLKHHDNWDVCRFYDNDLNDILPGYASSWNAFDRCEIGRWCAMKHALYDCDNAFYCDNDVRWYENSQIENISGDVLLYHHYCTDKVRRIRQPLSFKTGHVNLGMFRIKKDAVQLCDDIVNEVMSRKHRYMFNGKLWLQNLASLIPSMGYDARYDNDSCMNVAYWNIKTNDRRVYLSDGKHYTSTDDGRDMQLVSMHFSCCDLLAECGDVYRTLVEEYKK